MACPFCAISSVISPSPDPAIFSSSAGSAYPVLSTPEVIAFLDIAPLSRGHILICPRAHREKVSQLTPPESMAVGFWIPVLSRAVMRALWGGDEGHWNIIQANGAEAGQTVPHTHFHIIPRAGPAGIADRVGEMDDAERKNIALGEGPRAKLDPDDGQVVTRLVKVEVQLEIKKLREQGFIIGTEGSSEILGKTDVAGFKL